MFKMIKRNKKGFTLTELIVVIAILGVLAAVVTPSVLGYLSDAKVSADAANLATLDNCVKRLATKEATSILFSGTLATDKVAIIAAVAKEVNPIPVPNDTTNTKWLLTRVMASGNLESIGVTQVPAATVETVDAILLN